MKPLCLVLALAACARPPQPEHPNADAVFAAVCARCHGAEGNGGTALPNGVQPRNFHDAAFQAQRTDAELRRDIVEGRNGNMPAFGKSFTEEQLDGLVARVRSFNPQEATR